MDKARRKELTKGFLERERHMGVYAVRCAPTGDVWVGQSRNLDTEQGKIWFSNRQGASMNKAMVAAWKAHGEAAFSFEVLEEVDPEGMTALGLSDALKGALRAWRERLDAGLAAG